jgi:hypothetical protein
MSLKSRRACKKVQIAEKEVKNDYNLVIRGAVKTSLML